MTAGGPLLAIDTATTTAVIALGNSNGTLTEARSWVAGYRHGEELLARIEALLIDHGIRPVDLSGIVVGTGPGAFTGLRVGIATAKALAHALRLPIVGVATGSALLASAAAAARLGDPAPTATAARVDDPASAAAAASMDDPASAAAAAGADGVVGAAERTTTFVLLQPAGPNDRVFVRLGEAPRILAGGTDPDLRAGERLVAVDLDGRAPEDASALGGLAVAGLAAALVARAAARLAAGDEDDLARLVPEYVTLPRGVLAAPPDADGGVEMSGGNRGSRS